VEGGELKEYSAHVIPEGGYRMIPTLAADGLLVTGDAAALCLAAGIWLEGVNFAMASGLAAGEAAAAAVAAGDTSTAGLSGYRQRLEDTFVLQDHRSLRDVPHLVLSDRMQHQYPGFACAVVERVFRVDNPAPKPGLRRIVTEERRRHGVRWRDLLKDALTAGRSFS
jgi:electron transfer flavoprotein-quinone oxidoreductase